MISIRPASRTAALVELVNRRADPLPARRGPFVQVAPGDRASRRSSAPRGFSRQSGDGMSFMANHPRWPTGIRIAPSIGQAWRIARYDAGDWPSIKSVRNHFGRLSDAIAAAGLVPRHQGQHRPRPGLALDQQTRLHVAHLRAMRSSREPPEIVAAALRNVASARHRGELDDLRAALIELATAALAWEHMTGARR